MMNKYKFNTVLVLTLCLGFLFGSIALGQSQSSTEEVIPPMPRPEVKKYTTETLVSGKILPFKFSVAADIPSGYNQRPEHVVKVNQSSTEVITTFTNNHTPREHLKIVQTDAEAYLYEYQGTINISGIDVQYNETLRDDGEVVYAFTWNQNGKGFFIIALGIHDGRDDFAKDDLVKVIKSLIE
jgi:opacity protein-like surface antigen